MAEIPIESRELIVLEESETVALIYEAGIENPLCLSFGPGWVALKNPQDRPMSFAVKKLLAMRGISNENTNGAGI
jgi:hypothetical protein